MKLMQIPRKKIKFVLMVVSSLTIVAGMTWFIQSTTVKAYLPDMSSAQSRYPTIVGSRIDSCSLCHTSAPSLNPYGAAYKAAGRNPGALAAIEPLDSDGDGFTNLQEIVALYFPGNPTDHPPAVTATTIPPTPTNVPPTATRTPTSVPPTPTNTATRTVPPPTATVAPPTATKTAVPPTPTNTATNPPPTATRTVAPPTGTAVPPTATHTAVPPTVTNTAPPPPTVAPTLPPPPTATNTAPPPATATNTAPPPPTATNTVPPLPTSTKVATQVPTTGFTATSTVEAGETEEPTDDDHEGHHATPTRGPIPTRQPSPTPPCGYYREDGRSSSQGWSGFSGSDGDRGSLYRKCKPREDDNHDFVSRFVTQVGDFFSQVFHILK